jgi:hypothetical protein
MKRLMLAVVVAALGGLTTVALAGDYHVGSQLICSDCHVMHGSAAHASADSNTIYINPVGGPYSKLLRGETVNNTCLTCHDGRVDAPDVLCDSPNPPLNGRSAGALNVDPANTQGLSNTGTYGAEDGHTLFSTTPPPGNTGTYPVSTEGLECTDCHGAHGNKYYRNMIGLAAGATSSFIPPEWAGKEVNYQIGGTPQDTAWVYEALPHNYDNDNVHYQEPDQTRSAYGEWCGTCHSNFHGAPGSANVGPAGDEIRHPTAGADFSLSGWRNSNVVHRLKVMDASGQWATTTPTTTNMTPSCFTCHKSHGNNNKFGLVFILPNRLTNGPAPNPVRTAALSEEGDGGQLRDMCRNCHGMGSFPAGNPSNILP